MIAVLAGGVGAARLLEGLVEVVDRKELTVIVNTGDDLERYGLHVAPDLDTITYTLSGQVNTATGWGRADETWTTMSTLDTFGVDTWFRLGDRDLATHLYRSGRLAEGATLSQVTAEIAGVFGLGFALVPMSDDRVRTVVTLASGEVVDFQEYFVRRGHAVPVASVDFAGAEDCRAAPGVLEALGDAHTIIVAPSNPIVSIGPILAVPGVASLLSARRATVVAISPIVAGAALKGPADRLLVELGGRASALGVAEHLASVIGALVIDVADKEQAPDIERLGMRCKVAPTVMSSREIAVELAGVVLDLAASTW